MNVRSTHTCLHTFFDPGNIKGRSEPLPVAEAFESWLILASMANKLAAIVNKLSLLRGGLRHAQVVCGGVYVALHQSAAVIVLNKTDPSTRKVGKKEDIYQIERSLYLSLAMDTPFVNPCLLKYPIAKLSAYVRKYSISMCKKIKINRQIHHTC